MTFDTEKFIREIESRKAIWDMSSDEYSDRDLKRRRWEEIANVMCDEENVTENEKNELGKSLQQKWKNIRTCFSRELKRKAVTKSGSAASRKSPYVYFDQLRFLKDTVINNTTEESIEETGVSESNDEGGSVQIRPPVSKRQKTSNNESLLEVLKQSIATREERETKNDCDSDRLFMLSLLADFKKVPDHLRLSTKMELIAVINRAQTLPPENRNFEFGLHRQSHSDYELGTSAAGPYSQRYISRPNYGPEASGSGQYRHGYPTQPNYGPQASGSGQSHRRYSTPDTNDSELTQDSEILDLFS